MLCYNVLRYQKETITGMLGYQQSDIDEQAILSTVNITTTARNPANFEKLCGMRLTPRQRVKYPVMALRVLHPRSRSPEVAGFGRLPPRQSRKSWASSTLGLIEGQIQVNHAKKK